jgi:hypothetical protein
MNQVELPPGKQRRIRSAFGDEAEQGRVLDLLLFGVDHREGEPAAIFADEICADLPIGLGSAQIEDFGAAAFGDDRFDQAADMDETAGPEAEFQTV